MWPLRMGPLFQWLSSAPARWMGISTGTVYATWYTLPLLVIILSTFLTARLLLPEAAGVAARAARAARGRFLVAAGSASVPVLLAFAIFVRLTDSRQLVRERRSAARLRCRSPSALSLSWFRRTPGSTRWRRCLLCVAAADVGERRGRRWRNFWSRRHLFSPLMLAINAVHVFAIRLRFWRSSFAIANGYRWFEPIPMASTTSSLASMALAMGVLCLGAAWPRQAPRVRGPAAGIPACPASAWRSW